MSIEITMIYRAVRNGRDDGSKLYTITYELPLPKGLVRIRPNVFYGDERTDLTVKRHDEQTIIVEVV